MNQASNPSPLARSGSTALVDCRRPGIESQAGEAALNP